MMSRADVVLRMVSVAGASDGMQGVRGSNPLSFHQAQRIIRLRSERHLPENAARGR
jgi:hypothetical protein